MTCLASTRSVDAISANFRRVTSICAGQPFASGEKSRDSGQQMRVVRWHGSIKGNARVGHGIQKCEQCGIEQKPLNTSESNPAHSGRRMKWHSRMPIQCRNTRFKALPGTRQVNIIKDLHQIKIRCRPQVRQIGAVQI
ncbi:hypothetical protein AAGS40_05965 [Paraburkholderia sp. PREW-6R]|uniref:hypothetical protein n=1 Tax=Paraburkholderia sp. PREW-6R TaxID=3141544 RepID=UPI0031F4BFE0